MKMLAQLGAGATKGVVSASNDMDGNDVVVDVRASEEFARRVNEDEVLDAIVLDAASDSS